MAGIEPAQLSFLSIYNPDLGKREETEDDQILYYYTSKATKARAVSKHAKLSSEELQHEERNEQMRQIGLAQGMVGFARAFSDNKAVDYVDTEKARAWMHELEPGWWMVASVDMTRIESKPVSTKTKGDDGKQKPGTNVEYTPRELCPQALLREQFLRAHSIFLLHHGVSLADIYARRGRVKLCAALERFWNRTLRQWDVMMNGAPATDMFNGLKLAAGGELGIGVGEEEWGSGERAVLEDLVHNTEGLVDLVVSRFGDRPALNPKNYLEDPATWLGSGALPAAGDGVIFSGVGAISRGAVRQTSAWMESIVKHGLKAYGVQESPHSSRPRRRQREPALERRQSSFDGKRPNESPAPNREPSAASKETPKGIPPPLLSPEETRENDKGLFDTDTMVKYMTLGIYGSSWGITSGRPAQSPARSAASATSPVRTEKETRINTLRSRMEPESLEERAGILSLTRPDVIRGCFIIGMQGDLHDDPASDTEGETKIDIHTGTDDSIRSGSAPWERRNQLRTLYLERKTDFALDSKSPGNTVVSVTDRLRVVVYAKQPFLFTFLFNAAEQPHLSMPRFYRNLHRTLMPLHTPLVKTTSSEDVRRRILEAAGGHLQIDQVVDGSKSPIYDLVYDPVNSTCHTTIPNIPEIGEGIDTPGIPWSRADALAVHQLILRIWMDTRRRSSELERTSRTTRGWWVIWMRLPCSDDVGNSRSGSTTGPKSEQGSDEQHERGRRGRSRARTRTNTMSTERNNQRFREAFLVRRAPEKGYGAGGRQRASSGLWGMGGGSAAAGKKAEEDGTTAGGPGRLAEGIGIDTRKYIESLLSLNR